MSIDKITSAYNFVPLQAKVVTPDWQDRTSQDVPLQDGLCAEIDLTLTNHTPLLVGGSRPPRAENQRSEVSPSLHPDGRPVLPGSSLRGMIRNVLEIATASQMYRMDDRRLSVRDLDNKDKSLYSKHFTKSEGEDPIRVVPLSRAAWMRFHEGQWQLCHVPHVRVEHDALNTALGLDFKKWFAQTKDRTPQKKYEKALQAFPNTGNSIPLRVYFSVTQAKDVKEHTHQQGKLAIKYSKVSDIVRDSAKGYAVGRLVVTGQPSEKKHMEFIFQEPQPSSTWLTLDDALVNDFLRIHDTPETMLQTFKSDRNPFGKGLGFPVFYLCKEREGQGPKPKAEFSSDIRAIGLSQMFRLPYTHSLGEVARRQQSIREGRLDFARTLFGLVGDELKDAVDQPPSRRSRVSFGDFRLDGSSSDWMAPAIFSQPTVLNGAKPSYYPNYIVQKEAGRQVQKSGGQRLPRYTTLMDDQAQLRGWKRYPVHAPAAVTGVPMPPEKSTANVQTSLKPLKTGLKFSGRVRLHNVTKQELGALLWALTWGSDATKRHSLGMGKPFGLGQVSLVIRQMHIRANTPGQNLPTDPQFYLQAFEDYMKSNVPQWTGSIRELLHMANPAAAGVVQLQPMFLGMGRDNEFKEAKQAGLALQPYSAIR